MKGRSIPVLPILLMLAIAYCGYWLYKNTEYVEEEAPTPTSMESRKFDYLIAAKLLETQGFDYDKARSMREIYNLDVNETGVLWVEDLKYIEDERGVNAIRDWIIDGGTLITNTRRVYDDNDLQINFLNELGIHYDADSGNFSQLNLDINDESEEEDLYVRVPDEQIPGKLLQVELVGKPNLSYATENAVSSTENIIDSSQLIYNAVGDGYVAAVTDTHLFENEYLDDNQHGFLLLWLTQAATTKSTLFVSQLGDPPGLLGTLWMNAPIVIIALALVLAGYLRMASSRLGPVEYEELPNKNNLIAHLRARGEFWFKHHHTEKQFAEIQQAALAVLAKRRGESGLKQQNEEIDEFAVATQASDLLNCTPETAKRALFNRVNSGNELLKNSQYLQKILHLNTNQQPKTQPKSK